MNRPAYLFVVMTLFITLVATEFAHATPGPGEESIALLPHATLTALDFTAVRDFVGKGGRTMWFLGFLSVMGLTFTLERLVRLRRQRITPRGLASDASELWEAGRYLELRAMCGDPAARERVSAEGIKQYKPSSLGRMIVFMVRHRNNPVAEIAPVLADVGARELEWHYRRLYPLAVVATLAPLLGLFGTVVGMMGAFKQFRLLGETGDPSVFAGDISLALITTATGLAIAVPAAFFYHVIKSRTNGLREQLESEVAGLMSSWLLNTEEDE